METPTKAELRGRRTGKKLIKSNTSGVTGVYWTEERQLWTAKIRCRGVHFLGNFKDKADAIAARRAAELKFGFVAPPTPRPPAFDFFGRPY
jgi:hypothetical protein